MSSLPMPFFCTRGAILYSERVRLEKDALKKEFEKDSNTAEDAHRYSGKLMNYVWSQYNKYAPFHFQKNIELSPTKNLQMLGAHFETSINSKNNHF